jgi:hypothetical protein
MIRAGPFSPVCKAAALVNLGVLRRNTRVLAKSGQAIRHKQHAASTHMAHALKHPHLAHLFMVLEPELLQLLRLSRLLEG